MKKNKNNSIQWYLTTKQKKLFASFSVCILDLICLLFEIYFRKWNILILDIVKLNNILLTREVISYLHY